MFNHKHLTPHQKQQILEIVDDAGIVEVLRVIATIISQRHDNLEKALDYRGRIFGIAKELMEERP